MGEGGGGGDEKRLIGELAPLSTPPPTSASPLRSVRSRHKMNNHSDGQSSRDTGHVKLDANTAAVARFVTRILVRGTR